MAKKAGPKWGRSWESGRRPRSRSGYSRTGYVPEDWVPPKGGMNPNDPRDKLIAYLKERGVHIPSPNMTPEGLRQYILDNPEMITESGTSIEEFNKFYESTLTPGGPNDRPNLFGIFAESPQYQIPDEVFQKMELFQNTALSGVKNALQTRGSSMATLQEGIDKSLGTLETARDESLETARGDIDRIRDIGKRSRERQLDQAYASRKETLAELQRGGDKALDIQRLQAFGGMPGERMTREQMNADFAATQQSIKERAGGGSGALGAIAQGYGMKQGAERQLAIDRAEYQGKGMANLAAGEFAQSGRMADAMSQSRRDIIGIEQTSARDMSQSYLDTSRYYTGLQGEYAGQISKGQAWGGEAMAALDLKTSQGITDAAFAGANLMGGGFDTIAGERRQQFAINQYEPYMAQREFLNSELKRLDPFGVQAQYYGDLMGQGQSQYLAGVAGQNNASNNAFNAFGNAMGNMAQWGVNYESGRKDRSGNDVVYGNPQYDDPWDID